MMKDKLQEYALIAEIMCVILTIQTIRLDPAK